MKLALIALFVFVMPAFAYLTQDNQFICTGTEDKQCSADCCSQYNGAYIQSDGVCLLTQDSIGAKPMVAQCQERNGCCKEDVSTDYDSSSDSSSSSPGWCYCLPGLVLIGAVGFAATKAKL